MAESLSRSELLTKLVSVSDAHGVSAASVNDRTLKGAQEAILSKWFLGSRKVTYRMSCDFDEASRTVRFREATTESSRGMPPPTLTVEKTTQQGTRVSESRTDRSVGGGGHLNYGGLREAFEQVVQAGGWQFTVEVGKTP